MTFSPFELAASARRYSSEAILCLEVEPGQFAFFNRAFEWLGSSPDPDIRPWLALGREYQAKCAERDKLSQSSGLPAKRYDSKGKLSLKDLDI